MDHELSNTVRCIGCNAPTRMLGTKLCDPCWSLRSPRLAAREKAEAVAEFEDADGTLTYLVRTPFEWGVASDPLARLGATWSVHEGVAREVFRDATNTSACELCGTYRDDHDADEDGIYTCTAEHKAACEAACAKKGPTP